MKKIITISLFTLLTIGANGMAVYDAANHAENIASKLEALKQTVEQAQQTKNQMEQIKNQMKMLKTLASDVADGNIDKLGSVFNELETLMSKYKSLVLDSEKITKDYWSLFSKNPDDFMNTVGFGEEYLKEMDRRNKEARRLSDNALYDAMTQQGFSAKLGADKQNLQTLLTASKGSTGVLEAIQVTNSLLGQMNESILKLGIVTETATKADAMNKATESNEIETSKNQLKKMGDKSKIENEQKMNIMLQKTNKATTI